MEIIEQLQSQRHLHTGVDSLQIAFRDIDDIYTYRVTYNPGNLVDGTGETTDFTTTGAGLGDFVLISAPYNLQGVIATGYVKSANTVSIRLQNETGGTVDLASGTWIIKIIKK